MLFKHMQGDAPSINVLISLLLTHLYAQTPTMFGLNSAQANAAMVPFAAAPVMQQRNQSILAASKMVGAGCATIALAGEHWLAHAPLYYHADSCYQSPVHGRRPVPGLAVLCWRGGSQGGEGSTAPGRWLAHLQLGAPFCSSLVVKLVLGCSLSSLDLANLKHQVHSLYICEGSHACKPWQLLLHCGCTVLVADLGAR